MRRRDVADAVARLSDLLLPVLVPDEHERGRIRLRFSLAAIGNGEDSTVNGRKLGRLSGIAGSCLMSARTLLRGIEDGSSINHDALEASGMTLADIDAYADELRVRIRALERYARILSAEGWLDTAHDLDGIL